MVVFRTALLLLLSLLANKIIIVAPGLYPGSTVPHAQLLLLSSITVVVILRIPLWLIEVVVAVEIKFCLTSFLLLWLLLLLLIIV